MKLGEKHLTQRVYVEPKKEDCKSDEEFTMASTAFEFYRLLGLPSENLKTESKVIRENTLLQKGAEIRVERWDGNGIDEIQTIKEIHWELDYPEVICEEGWFVFNPNEEFNDFNWISKGREWYKNSMKWVPTKFYYIEKQL